MVQETCAPTPCTAPALMRWFCYALRSWCLPGCHPTAILSGGSLEPETTASSVLPRGRTPWRCPVLCRQDAFIGRPSNASMMRCTPGNGSHYGRSLCGRLRGLREYHDASPSDPRKKPNIRSRAKNLSIPFLRGCDRAASICGPWSVHPCRRDDRTVALLDSRVTLRPTPSHSTA